MTDIIIRRSGEFKGILDREDALSDVEELTKVTEPLLIEAIDHSAWAFARCGNEKNAMRGENIDVAPLALHAHVLEMGDGVQELLSRSCANPAMPLLRSMFEAFLQLSFMMDDDDEYESRALQWFVCYLHRRIESLDYLDPDTDRGKELQRTLAAENTNIQLPTENVEECRKVVESLRSVLTVSTVAPIEQMYQELKRDKKNRRKNTFYELFHGENLKSLADHHGYGSYYTVLYRHWTHVAHAGDLHRFLTAKDGKGAFYRLRNPLHYKTVADVSVHIIAMTTNLMIRHFRREEDLERWYLETFKPLRTKFDGFKVIFEDCP